MTEITVAEAIAFLEGFIANSNTDSGRESAKTHLWVLKNYVFKTKSMLEKTGAKYQE